MFCRASGAPWEGGRPDQGVEGVGLWPLTSFDERNAAFINLK